jgi:hypothetical protein
VTPVEVIAFFRDTITANWSYTPILWPNEQEFDAAGQPHLVVTFPIAREEFGSIGAPESTYLPVEGAAHISLLTQIGGGLNDPSAPWQTRLLSLQSALRPKAFANGAGNTWSVSSSSEYVDDSFFVRNLVVPYSFRKFG